MPDMEEEARRVYAPGDVAKRLGVGGQRLRQLAVIYERVRGDLPRDRRGRVWPEEAVEDLERAHAAVAGGRAGSVEQALRAPGSATEGAEGARQDATPEVRSQDLGEGMAALLAELKRVREAVEEMTLRMENLERENRELREAVTGPDARGLEEAKPSGSPGTPEDVEAEPNKPEHTPTTTGGLEGHRKPWWRRIFGA